MESEQAEPGESLHTAVRRGDRRRVLQLLAERVPIDEPDNQGMTPLSCAVWAGDDKLVELLLQHGADANRATSDGVTPLQRATDEDLPLPSIAAILRRHGAREPAAPPLSRRLVRFGFPAGCVILFCALVVADMFEVRELVRLLILPVAFLVVWSFRIWVQRPPPGRQ